MLETAKQNNSAAQGGIGIGVVSVTPRDSDAKGITLSTDTGGVTQGAERGKDNKST